MNDFSYESQRNGRSPIQKLSGNCWIEMDFIAPKPCMKEQTCLVRKMTENAMMRTFRTLGDPRVWGD